MTRPPRPRRVRIAACAATLVAAGTVLSACAASAGDLARASCAHVNASISLYERSVSATDPVRAKALADKAYLELLAAIPIAAQAAYHDIQWESLSATLAEASRVPESELLPSLRAQCRNADASVFGQTPPPSSPSGGGSG
ncbi:MAG TPA: hypothetical protein VND44_13555 [Acidimicrobiales bacterium]|nr:hypothetical protein [Acidimicrobiales bacterium]